MALERTECRVSYRDGIKKQEYDLPFQVHEQSHLLAYVPLIGRGRASLDQGVDYEIVTEKDETGQNRIVRLRLLRDIAGMWIIERVVPLTQENLFHAQGPNSARVLEKSLDKLTMITQQLAEQIREATERADTLEARFETLAERTDHADRHAANGPDEITPGSIRAVSDTDPRLADAREALPHVLSHHAGGRDAISPENIGATPAEHLTDPHPHSQYVLANNYCAEKFFTYDPQSGLLRLKDLVESGAVTPHSTRVNTGVVMLKGTAHG